MKLFKMGFIFNETKSQHTGEDLPVSLSIRGSFFMKLSPEPFIFSEVIVVSRVGAAYLGDRERRERGAHPRETKEVSVSNFYETIINSFIFIKGANSPPATLGQHSWTVLKLFKHWFRGETFASIL